MTDADASAERPETNDFYCDNVLSGAVAVERLAENEYALAFRHTRPMWTQHIVVIPKRHVGSLVSADLDEATLSAVMDLVRRLAERVLTETGGCRVLTNLGRFQDSKHLHWHVSSGDLL
jgi:histidine triad (HIT) family protein